MHDIRVGDVCRSEQGKRLVTVVPNSEYKGYGLDGSRDVVFRGATGAVMISTAGNFLKRRTLIERGGVRIGDVRKDHVPLIVVKIEHDHAGCDSHPADGGGLTWIPLDVVAAMPLLTRDGKAVTP